MGTNAGQFHVWYTKYISMIPKDTKDIYIGKTDTYEEAMKLADKDYSKHDNRLRHFYWWRRVGMLV